ncbi:oligopeptide ABC transporter permease [Peribacillus deserti]|uniref:Peptide ABC transporter permease n=1 Tax=Peribacillus deserti TaxID=673318 RepID=A0A2N5M7M5_9BACI|nr:oligopeptide ABC transporter permease [Peribacillus deserti]PLT30378.1 peptide ABC transporter permease [Peribacillus deserti]
MEQKQLENLSPDLFRPAAGKEDLEKIGRPSLSYWQDAWIRLKKNKGAIFGLIIVILITLLAIFAPVFSSHTYREQNLALSKLPPKIPVLEHVGFLGVDGKDKDGFDVYKAKNVKEYYWFGTDDLGRDQWVRVWQGTRISLLIAVAAALIDLFIGIIYGGVAGFYGGRTDNIMMRIIEILIGIPHLIIVILFILIFKPGVTSIILAMVITGWTGMARIVRGQILKMKEQEFVLASKTLGAANSRLIGKHLIPNVLGPIIVTTMFSVPGAIFTEAFLSFIGLGIAPPQASLGSLVNDGFRFIQTYPYQLIIPSIVISLLILSFNLLGDGLRDALDPKMRK